MADEASSAACRRRVPQPLQRRAYGLDAAAMATNCRKVSKPPAPGSAHSFFFLLRGMPYEI